MLTYDLQKTEGPLYEALYNAIKTDILTGVLGPNEKLPSKRRMASNNGISVITVENAYGRLLSEGYIQSKPKSGFYVCDIKGLEHEIPKTDIFEPSKNDAIQSKHIADFSNNQTPTDLFPFDDWSKATRSVLSRKHEELLENSPSCGVLQLRRSIAEYLKEYRGLEVDESTIVVGAGSEFLYGLIVQLIGRDVVYGIENPGYRKQELTYKAQGVQVEHLRIDDKGVQAEELEDKDIGVVHITPSHQYPTGIVMPISRRYELLAWAAEKHGRYIIEDDYDSELRLDGKPIPSFKSIDRKGCVIYLNTFSKTLCSTVRISYMVLPPKLMSLFNERLSFYSCTVSTFEQYTLLEFMEKGSMGTHINRLRTYYRRKRDAFINALKDSPLGEKLEISGEKTGLHFLMKVNTKKKEGDVLRSAENEGIGLCSLSSFQHNENNEHNEYNEYNGGKSHTSGTNTFVMNYATLDIKKLDEIVGKLCKVFD